MSGQRVRYNWPVILLVAVWVVYLAAVGPFLLSAPSDAAAILSLSIGLILLFCTYHQVLRAIYKAK